MVKKLSITDWIIFTGFFGLALFLTLNRHSKSGYFNYHSEIWADKSGYYIYLPATIIYGFSPEVYPAGIDDSLGNGFQLDYVNQKVRTKYSSGVAILQLPFFMTAHILAKPLGYESNGFSPIYHWILNVAAVFYLLLGLIFLKRFLSWDFKNNTIWLVLLTLFSGTNLYYYAIDETVMSHVYSFSLFGVFLFMIRKTKYLKHSLIFDRILFGLLCGLIVLVRPSNIIFLSVFLFLDITNTADILKRLRMLFRFPVLLPVVLSVLIVWVPQFIYWYYLDGKIISYTYTGEGFIWSDPQLLQTWFSPLNGLFLYSPFYLVVLAGLFYMIFSKRQNGIYILVLFILISYVFSCWWDYSFGCSFGGRNFVEYLALFSIPIAFLFQKINSLSKTKIIGFWIIVVLFVGLNMKLIYTYDECFEGARGWDWDSYYKLLFAPTK